MNRSDPDRFDSRKWILGFFAIVLAAVLVLSVAAYAIDPFLQFRDGSFGKRHICFCLPLPLLLFFCAGDGFPFFISFFSIVV